MKLMVPYASYTKHCGNNTGVDMAMNFLTKFLDGAEPVAAGEDEMLGEMVDEFGNLYGEKDDLPANIRGDSGYYQHKDSSEKSQYSTQQALGLNNGSMGFGAVSW
jgi:hypothetical protein